MTVPARINGSDKNTTAWQPSEKQARYLEASMHCGLWRSIAELAREAGVARSTVHTWLKDGDFVNALEALPRAALRLHITSVLMAMIRKAQEGGVSAAKLVLQAAKLIGSDAVAEHTIAITNSPCPRRQGTKRHDTCCYTAPIGCLRRTRRNPPRYFRSRRVIFGVLRGSP